MKKLFKVDKKNFFDNKMDAKARRKELNGMTKDDKPVENIGAGFTVSKGPDHWRYV